MNNNAPLYISLSIVSILALLLLYGFNNMPITSDTQQDAQNNGQSVNTINENEIAKQRSTATNWSYQSDKRSFDQRPPDMTAKNEGWDPQKNDMMVLVTPKTKKMRPYYIDAFEAYISNFRAWSVPEVYPTDKIKAGDAVTACQAAGKRLCTELEWRTACRGGIPVPIEFKKPEEILRLCDFARSSGYDRTDYVEKTDSHLACTPPGLPIHHMIGNLAEFVRSPTGTIMSVGLTYYDGQIKSNPTALKYPCERTVTQSYPPSQYNKGMGFRCCKDAQ